MEAEIPGRVLVVLLHALGISRYSRLRHVRHLVAATRQAMPHARVFVPPLATGYLSNADPGCLARQIVEEVNRLDDEEPFDEVVLVGYSIGGLIARAAFIEAWKVEARWRNRVGRLILLAGTNRGWSFAPTVNAFLDLFRRTAYLCSRGLGLSELLAATRRGSPFVTDLRLEWLDLTRRQEQAADTLVVQLLGTIDDVVSPDDNIDVQTGQDFVYLEARGSGHVNVVDFSAGLLGQKRREVYLSALTGARESLEKASSSAVPVIDVDESVTDVVFVVHGIRDYGFWTSHLGRAVEAKGRPDRRVVALTPSYGYFGMLPFILNWRRREKVRWLMEQYVEARVRYPRAQISYIAHSHGTYLLARALKDYAMPTFHHVVFAGSVVRSDYPWDSYAGSRIHKVLNYVAASDVVVAIFPRWLGFLGRFTDLGGAGHDGFTSQPPDPSATVNDVEYIAGAHSSALRDFNWDYIAQFVLDGSIPDLTEPALAEVVKSRHSWWGRSAAAGATIVWLLLLALVLLPVILLLGRAAADLNWGWPLQTAYLGEWLLFFVLWVLLMRTILVRA